DPAKVGQRCDFCGSAQLVPYEQVKDVFRPESLLPLKVSEPQARDLIRNWYKRRWFAPNKLRTKALTDTAKALYLPYWTFDAKSYQVVVNGVTGRIAGGRTWSWIKITLAILGVLLLFYIFNNN